MTLAVVFALAAAFSNAVNLLTQHAASIGAPEQKKIWHLAVYLFRHPLWLLGGAAAVASYVFQALALHNGPLSVVQPVLVTELIFVLVLRRVWIHQDVALAAWGAGLVVCASLAVFLAAAEPTGGHPVPETRAWLSAVLVSGGLITALVLLGRRGSPVRRAASFAAASPLTSAPEAVLLQARTRYLPRIRRRRQAHPLAGVRAGRHHGPRHAAAAGRPSRGAVERIPAAADHRRSPGQHRFQRLAVRRALYRQPGEDFACHAGVRRDGRRGHHADSYRTSRPQPIGSGQALKIPAHRRGEQARRCG